MTPLRSQGKITPRTSDFRSLAGQEPVLSQGGMRSTLVYLKNTFIKGYGRSFQWIVVIKQPPEQMILWC
jgi:hypothetical protein